MGPKEGSILQLHNRRQQTVAGVPEPDADGCSGSVQKGNNEAEPTEAKLT